MKTVYGIRTLSDWTTAHNVKSQAGQEILEVIGMLWSRNLTRLDQSTEHSIWDKPGN